MLYEEVRGEGMKINIKEFTKKYCMGCQKLPLCDINNILNCYCLHCYVESLKNKKKCEENERNANV